MLDLTWAFNQLLIVALHQNGLNIKINLGNTAICELKNFAYRFSYWVGVDNY